MARPAQLVQGAVATGRSAASGVRNSKKVTSPSARAYKITQPQRRAANDNTPDSANDNQEEFRVPGGGAELTKSTTSITERGTRSKITQSIETAGEKATRKIRKRAARQIVLWTVIPMWLGFQLYLGAVGLIALGAGQAATEISLGLINLNDKGFTIWAGLTMIIFGLGILSLAIVAAAYRILCNIPIFNKYSLIFIPICIALYLMPVVNLFPIALLYWGIIHLQHSE